MHNCCVGVYIINTKKMSSSSPRRKKGRWLANSTTESQKLAAKEDDWDLAGIGRRSVIENRTRGKRVQLPPALVVTTRGNKKKRKTPSSDGEDSTDDEQDEPSTMTNEDTATATAVSSITTTTTATPKPGVDRVILEVRALQELVERNLAKCKSCLSPLKIDMVTCCLASRPRVCCSNSKCCYVDYGTSPAPANVPLLPGSGSALIERTTDYAINVLYL